MTAERLRRLTCLLAAAATGACLVAGCATDKGLTRTTTPAAMEETEPLPPDMKPLTVEQEENVAAMQ